MQSYLKVTLTGFIAVFLSIAAWGQAGSISGKITDATTNEILIGASVAIKGTTIGGATDIEGNYTIQHVDAGQRTLVVQYVGYEPKEMPAIVKSGQNTRIDIKLKTRDYILKAAEVEARASKKSSASLMEMKKQSLVIQDFVSAEEFSRSGDGDAGAAMKRVTGASVVDGKYVFIRGLSDRYVKTTLNGLTIPSLDPNRNTAQMDLFPTALIDNITVMKSVTPDLPGDFTGGIVNVTTKDYPDSFVFSLGGAIGYNPQSSFTDNYLTYQGGKTDWMAIDDGTRAIPDELKDPNVVIPPIGQVYGDDEAAAKLDRMSKAFNPYMTPSRKNSFTDYGLSLALGNQTTLFQKKVGINVGITYDHDYDFYENGEYRRDELQGSDAKELNNQLLLVDSKGTEQVIWGTLANVALEINKNNDIGLNLLYNRSGEQGSRFLIGKFPELFLSGPGVFYETSVLDYKERSLGSMQLHGKHVINSKNGWELQWRGSRIVSIQNEPDIRFFTDHYFINSDHDPVDTSYLVSISKYTAPSRYFRELREENYEGQLDLIKSFKIEGREGKVQFGGAVTHKDRSFTERRFEYVSDRGGYAGEGDAFFDEAHVGLYQSEPTPLNRFLNFIRDKSKDQNNYNGTQQIGAAYALADLPISTRHRLTGGVRLEYTEMLVTSKDTAIAPGKLQNFDVLPSLNYSLDLTEKMKLRAAYGRTLARPTFREIAPYASFNFVGDFVEVGNNELQRTRIDNLDLRWEVYPKIRELIAVSAFYKHFANPIERVIEPRAGNPEIHFRNLESGQVFGAEIELRKNMDMVSEKLKNFSVGLNAAYIYSEVKIDADELALIRATDPGAEDTRSLQGQSPYLANANVVYTNSQSKTMVSVFYNVAGPRLHLVTPGGTPDDFEQPRHLVDMGIQQRFGSHATVSLKVKNLLSEPYSISKEYLGVDYNSQLIPSATEFSLGFSYNF